MLTLVRLVGPEADVTTHFNPYMAVSCGGMVFVAIGGMLALIALVRGPGRVRAVVALAIHPIGWFMTVCLLGLFGV